MPRPEPRNLTVVKKAWITPRLLRITLGGGDLADFPAGRESANCKIIVPSKPNGTSVRTYTIRSFDAVRREVDIDFFIHENPGPASYWAANAALGSELVLKGPSSPKLVNSNADYVLLAGDMSALPAISANLELLDDKTTGFAVLEVVDRSDQHPLQKPPGVSVQWVMNPHPEKANQILVEAVKAIELPLGSGGVWIAGESSAVKTLRNHFKQELGFPRESVYASGYWQIGLSEDLHQVAKRSIDAEAT